MEIFLKLKIEVLNFMRYSMIFILKKHLLKAQEFYLILNFLIKKFQVILLMVGEEFTMKTGGLPLRLVLVQE
jgi:hypothetical protein